MERVISGFVYNKVARMGKGMMMLWVTTAIAVVSLLFLSTDASATSITISANTAVTDWNQWIDTGVDLMSGDSLTISAMGQASSAFGRPLHGPGGVSPAQSPNQTESLVNTANLGALVGMIDYPQGNIPTYPTFTTQGLYLLDDGIGGSLFGPGFVGSSFTQVLPSGVWGRLYLGFNDGFDADNSGNYTATISVTPGAAVPEPATMLLLGLGLIGLAGVRRKFR